jgi:8-oxo-dGTP pyrophosphatase MutT (NUDIX family)
MNTVIATAGVVAFTPDLKRVLLIKHSEKAGHKTGMYGIPAGRLEEGEDAKHAAIRELQEEAGLLINDRENLIPLHQTYSVVIERKDGQREYALEPFIYILEEGVRLQGSEEGEPELVLLGDIDSLKLLPNVKAMVADAYKKVTT